MRRQTAALIVAAIEKAEAGVDYSARIGASCPACGRKAKIYKTMPWEGCVRIRYHHCVFEPCLLFGLRKSIKSVEEE